MTGSREFVILKVVVCVILFVLFLALIQFVSISNFLSKEEDSIGISTQSSIQPSPQISQSSQTISTNGKDSLETSTVEYKDTENNPIQQPNGTQNQRQNNWLGVEISSDNPLYKSIALNKISKINCEKIARFQSNKWNEDLLKFYQEWIPKVGYNSIIDCINRKNVSISSHQLHGLGEILVEYTDSVKVLNGNEIKPRHLIEVNGRNILHHAPLHGAVWKLIENYGIQNTTDFFSFVQNELCWFQDYPTAGDVWISCKFLFEH